MKKLWKSSLAGKIFVSICIGVGSGICILILVTLYGYVSAGVINEINKEDKENIEYLKKENKVFESQFEKQGDQNKRIEEHMENNASAWQSVIEEIQKINSKFTLYEYRLNELEK